MTRSVLIDPTTRIREFVAMHGSLSEAAGTVKWWTGAGTVERASGPMMPWKKKSDMPEVEASVSAKHENYDYKRLSPPRDCCPC